MKNLCLVKGHTGIKGGLIIVSAILKIKTVIKNKCHLRVITQTLIRTPQNKKSKKEGIYVIFALYVDIRLN